MGIDLYAKWDDMDEGEAEAQITGFSIFAGSVGYLREAYHGGPYVTAWLAPEGFLVGADYDHVATWIGKGASALVGSMVATLQGAAPGDVIEYQRLAESADGFPPEGYLVECAEDDDRALIPAAVLRRRLPLCEALNQRRYPLEAADVNNSYRAFVALYERLEAEGKRPGIHVSY